MTHIKKYLIGIFLVAIGFGCEDKLDLYPLTGLSEGTFYRNLSQLEAAVDDVYRQMGIIYNARSIPSLYGTLFSDNGAVIAQLAGTPVDQPIDRHEIFSENSRIQNAWDDAYSAIYICNNAIFRLESTDISIEESHKNRMIAEALVVRSLAYFNLVRAFGEVPLITSRISPSQSYDYLREDTDVIYSQLIQDLNFAKNNLQESYTGLDIGRVTKFGAAAILAKIHLTNNDYDAAGVELEYIINSNLYSLDATNDGTVNLEDYNYLFDPDTKNSKSSVLEVQFMAGANARNSDHQEAFSPYLDGFNHPFIDGTITRGNGINTPTEDFEMEFEEGDPRKAITIVPGFTSRATGSYVDYPFTLKYFDPNWFNPGQNFEIIR
ncbi:MAG: RagB/SusD family nutrient uptake outer membrane protein, partial [Cyclobacteriaceae bacterium]